MSVFCKKELGFVKSVTHIFFNHLTIFGQIDAKKNPPKCQFSCFEHN